MQNGCNSEPNEESIMFDHVEWLFDDVQQNKKVLATNDSQLARRNYLRSLSAFYEFILCYLRETTAKLLIDEFEINEVWKIHELYPLMDETTRLSENGELKLDPNRLPFVPLVAYTLKTYARLIGFDREVLSDNGWNAFRETIKVRNRITHPKFYNEIEITDIELKMIDDGWTWWNTLVEQLSEADYKKMVGD